ncbi:hypothetical protein F5887DRAFT_71718 [Amanita rubescens]|nr:hypothetical protein F5887DRAFT_71718 [Amanita rubescens]
MTTETAKLKSRLSALASSVNDLEELLEPLFAQSLPESIMALEPMQQAKLQTVLPYLVYDLIFIYLKARGIDPRSHPVVSELDRVKQYFEKITSAEKSGKRKEPATKIDKEAAGRFIKHAIAQASKQPTRDEPTPLTSSSGSAPVPVPVKVTSKMEARAEYERQLKEQDAQSSEEEELEVIDGADNDNGMDIDKSSPKVTSGALTDKIDDEDQTQVGNKRRRRPVDPFAGYGDDLSTSDHGVQSQLTSYSVPRPQADTGKIDSSDQNSASSTPSIRPTSSSQNLPSKPENKKRKKSKKQKKPAV